MAWRSDGGKASHEIRRRMTSSVIVSRLGIWNLKTNWKMIDITGIEEKNNWINYYDDYRWWSGSPAAMDRRLPRRLDRLAAMDRRRDRSRRARGDLQRSYDLVIGSDLFITLHRGLKDVTVMKQKTLDGLWWNKTCFKGTRNCDETVRKIFSGKSEQPRFEKAFIWKRYSSSYALRERFSRYQGLLQIPKWDRSFARERKAILRDFKQIRSNYQTLEKKFLIT